jgi:hypothetical protein
MCEELPYGCTAFVMVLIPMSFLYGRFRGMRKVLDLVEREIMKRND